MAATFPVFDAERGLLIIKEDGLPAAQPCGDCPEWSIYGVCWRDGGCGVTPCQVDVQLFKSDPPGLDRAGCGIHKFIYTATRLNQLVWGPFASPLTGTVSVEFTIDGVSVKGPTSQNVVETIDYSDAYTWDNPSYFASGWHSCKAFVTWEGTKEGVGQTTIREMYAACVYAGIRPSGEDELALHDVIILPGSGLEVCISETLRAVYMLGPYRHYDDADYVRQQWAAIIETWAERCLCPGTCESGPVDQDGGVNGASFPPGETLIDSEYIAPFVDCTPSQYPIYAKFTATAQLPSGCNLYMRSTDDNGTTDTLIEDATSYDITIPPCTTVVFVVVNENEETATDCVVGYGSAYWSNFPNPDTWQTDPPCPYEDDLTDMVPMDADALLIWLGEQE